jgi:SAM-dependent methyltransferase
LEKPSSSPWYESAFDALYLTVYSHRNRDDALRALAFLQREAGIQSASRILDCCCGAGRHLLELLRAGCNVYGFDLSRALLEKGKEDLRGSGFDSRIVQARMERIPFRDSFDLAISLFTSFGYFETDEENAAVFHEVSQALKPGGIYVIDFLNAPQVRANLVEASREKTPSGVELDVRRAIEGDPLRVVKRMRITGGAEPREIVESVRLFNRRELESMITDAGLKIAGAWGDFDSAPHTDDSPRCILLAQKPA